MHPTLPSRPGASPSVEHLLVADGPSSRLWLYLRMLYSARSADLAIEALSAQSETLPQATRQLLESVDFERLPVERGARLGALNRALAVALQPLYRVIDLAQGRSLLGRFVDQEQFWTGSARSLGEAFAIFVASSPDVPDVVQDLAHLAGVMSGLVERPGQPSPWPDAQQIRRSAGPTPVLAEAFNARRALLRQDGSFFDAAQVAAGEAPAGDFRITVAVTGADSCAVSCQPCS